MLRFAFPILILFSGLLFSDCTKKMGDTSPPAAFQYYSWDSFSMGADLSYVNQIENYGGTYTDSGVASDAFTIFKNHGCNTVRVRLWNNPAWYAGLNDGRIYSNLPDVVKTIQRAKALGMAVNLDFHYSDIWADPQRQEVPEAWKNLDLPTLSDSVYQFTYSVLTHLDSLGLCPEMVQIGNEVNHGMMHPLGAITDQQFGPFGTLVNSGIRATRDFSSASGKPPQIILHYAQLQGVLEWMEQVTLSGEVHDYDIIGLSHYSKWSTVHTMPEITATIRSLKELYKKKVMLVEAGYPWTGGHADNYPNLVSDADAVAGYPLTPQDQFRYMKDLTQAVIDGGGSGVQVWEPAWITSNLSDLWGTGSAWENMTFFDFEGETLPGIDFMRVPYRFE
ncbi:MAG: glycosyl hydrolase 53 family protein [Saprospiraceae bacterium]